jgi:enamine deaminase RidA (YjgF/YER057c/UK114 family)
MSIQRIGAGPRMSQAVVHGGLVFLAGQVAEKPEGASVGEQTRQVLSAVDRLLAEAGSDKTRVLSATVYLADIATFAEMNAVWDAWVAPGAAPARATVEAKLAAPVYKVEIACVAAQAAK